MIPAVLPAATIFVAASAMFSVLATYKYVKKKTEDANRKLENIPLNNLNPPPDRTHEQLMQEAQDRLKMDTKNYVNFGMCGGSGSGKSTLINVFLNRDDVDSIEGDRHDFSDSAPVDCWQTTNEILCYGHYPDHQLNHIRFWDIPGCGTHQHGSENYFEEKALYAFDVLVLVTERNLRDYDYTILKKATEMHVPICIAITKADQKLETKLRNRYQNRNRSLTEYKELVTEIINQGKQIISKELESQGLPTIPTFIISSWKYRDLFKSDKDSEYGQLESNQDEDLQAAALTTDDPQPTSAAIEELEKLAIMSFELADLHSHLADCADQRRQPSDLA